MTGSFYYYFSAEVETVDPVVSLVLTQAVVLMNIIFTGPSHRHLRKGVREVSLDRRGLGVLIENTLGRMSQIHF